MNQNKHQRTIAITRARCATFALTTAVAAATAIAPATASATEAHILAKTFGSATSSIPDPYPLAEPNQVAIEESTGDVYVADPAVSDRQTVTVIATGGTLTLTFTNPLTHEEKTTQPIEASAFSEPRGLSEIKEVVGAANITYRDVEPHVRSGAEEHIVEFEFAGALIGAAVPAMTCAGSGLTGPGASCSVRTDATAVPGDDVEKFSPAGELIWILGNKVDKRTGGDLCTIASHDECQPGAPGSAPGQFQEPRFVAVDNSSGSSKGDIYVGDLGNGLVSKFTAEGQLVASWGNDGPGGAPDGQLAAFVLDSHVDDLVSALATSTAGNLYWAQAFDAEIIELGPEGHLLKEISHQREPAHSADALTVNTAGDLYLVEGHDQLPINREERETRPVIEVGERNELLAEVDPGPATGLAVDSAGEDLYVAKNSEVTRYGMAGEALEPFIGYDEGLTATTGLAVGPAHVLYVAEPGGAEIDVYTLQSAQPPTSSIEAPSGAGYTKVAVSGHVNPEGHTTVCGFEYVSEAHFKAEQFNTRHFKSGHEEEVAIKEGYEPLARAACEPELVGSGSGAVAVHAKLEKLAPTTVYHVRLMARNAAGTTYSVEPNPTFETKPAAKPTVTIEPASSVTATSATFTGHIDPNAPEPLTPEIEEAFAVRWRFQCTPECGEHVGTIGAGSTTEAVSATANLLPGTHYEVSLVAKNGGPAVSVGPISFTTPAVAPSISSTFPTGVTSAAATLNATLDPGGAATTVHFQYVTAAQFDADGEKFGEGTESTGETGVIGSDDNQHEASTGTEGLVPNTAYEFRVIATNSVGTIEGPPTLLYTYPFESSGGCANEQLRLEDNSTALPNCRAYELVSSPTASGDVYVPNQGTTNEVLKSNKAARAAASGEGVVYLADPSSSGGNGLQGNGLGNQWLASRGDSGWSTDVITPAASQGTNASGYVAFSEDLSRQIVYNPGRNTATGIIPTLGEGAPSDCRVLYAHEGTNDESGFRPLFTETQEHQAGPYEDCGNPFFAGSNSGTESVPAGAVSVFQTEAALTPGAKPAVGPILGDIGEECARSCNLYASTPAGLRLIDLLPSNEQAPGAVFGGPAPEGGYYSDFDNAISADGTRAFWTNTATGKIYARENVGGSDEKTVQISVGAAQYWTATPDGRYVYYTESGGLYRFNLEAEAGHQREALVPTSAGVQGVIGVNEAGEDGAYVYFVAEGQLAPGAQARSCQAGSPEQKSEEERGSLPAGLGCNLYLSHEGQTSFIAALSALDNDHAPWPGPGQGITPMTGDWIPDIGLRTAQLTLDGHSLIFRSLIHLTGAGGHAELGSIYDYDAEDGRLACVSCQPAGVPLESEQGAGSSESATATPLSVAPTYAFRWISADGERVFFETEQRLVPQDTNGLENVYEWEREGAPECPERSPPRPNGGCVRLLSDGEGKDASDLLDASASGNDVFFITRDDLLPAAAHEQLRLFDARVDGGFPAATGALVQPPECQSSEACLPPATEAPFQSFPATSVFSGAGNISSPFALPPPPIEKKITKKTVKCKKGKKLKHNKCVTVKTKKRKQARRKGKS